MTMTCTKKTGIMGGTFNPIHIGHLLLAENARDSFGLDEILFIPTGCSYRKDFREIADKQRRYEMTALAIEEHPSFSISAMEIEREGDTYTYETLLQLKKMQPQTEFYFIAGADSLFSMETWKKPEVIFRSCIILAAVREDKGRKDLKAQINYLEKKFQAQIQLLPMHEINLSSTDIRHRLKTGQSIKDMVPERVISYIQEHHLYTEDEKWKLNP